MGGLFVFCFVFVAVFFGGEGLVEIECSYALTDRKSLSILSEQRNSAENEALHRSWVIVRKF